MKVAVYCKMANGTCLQVFLSTKRLHCFASVITLHASNIAVPIDKPCQQLTTYPIEGNYPKSINQIFDHHHNVLYTRSQRMYLL